jgi:hypothetical protein
MMNTRREGTFVHFFRISDAWAEASPSVLGLQINRNVKSDRASTSLSTPDTHNVHGHLHTLVAVKRLEHALPRCGDTEESVEHPKAEQYYQTTRLKIPICCG